MTHLASVNAPYAVSSQVHTDTHSKLFKPWYQIMRGMKIINKDRKVDSSTKKLMRKVHLHPTLHYT